MFILCPGSKTVYNSDKITRYYVVEVEDDDGNYSGEWAVVGDAEKCGYYLAYFNTEDEAIDAMMNMMMQIQTNEKWIMLGAK